MESPFHISSTFVSNSRFKNVKDVQDSLKKYHNGESIGFSKTASLKSMGLLPRSNGKFVLGKKYLDIKNSKNVSKKK